MSFVTSKSLPRRTVLRGSRRDARAAVSRRDGAGVRDRRARRVEAGAPLPGLLRPERDGHGVLDAEGRGRRVRAVAGPRAARAVPRSDAGAQRPEGELELHPRRRLGIVSHRHDPRRQKRSRDRRRRVDGPAARAPVREGDAGRVPRDGHRSAGQRRRLHREPELRLHAHLVVAQPDAAAAGGVQPARGVREAVRRRRQHRAGGARGAAAAAQEHSRLRERQAGPPAAASWVPRIRARSTSTPNRSATSSGGSRRPRSSAISRSRRSTSRRACRRCSRITSR